MPGHWWIWKSYDITFWNNNNKFLYFFTTFQQTEHLKKSFIDFLSIEEITADFIQTAIVDNLETHNDDNTETILRKRFKAHILSTSENKNNNDKNFCDKNDFTKKFKIAI